MSGEERVKSGKHKIEESAECSEWSPTQSLSSIQDYLRCLS